MPDFSRFPHFNYLQGKTFEPEFRPLSDGKSLPFNPKNGNFVEFMDILLVRKHDTLLALNKGYFPKLLLNKQVTK